MAQKPSLPGGGSVADLGPGLPTPMENVRLGTPAGDIALIAPPDAACCCACCSGASMDARGDSRLAL
jgi:hypothetical protein